MRTQKSRENKKDRDLEMILTGPPICATTVSLEEHEHEAAARLEVSAVVVIICAERAESRER